MKIELSQMQIASLRDIVKKEKSKLKKERFDIFCFKTRREWELENIINQLTDVKGRKNYEC